MSVVKRRRDAIDALEHAMQGVQTTEKGRIERRNHVPDIIGSRSEVWIHVDDNTHDTSVEREVTVVIRSRPRRERMR